MRVVIVVSYSVRLVVAIDSFVEVGATREGSFIDEESETVVFGICRRFGGYLSRCVV